MIDLTKDKTREGFLNKYSKDIKCISFMWVRKLNLDIDVQDIIQEVNLRALTSRAWYDEDWHNDEGHGSKVSTFLYIVIKNILFTFLKEQPKEIAFSKMNHTRLYLENGYYKEFEITLEELIAYEGKESDLSISDYTDEVRSIQVQLYKEKPILGYIFYGYLLGYNNWEIAQKLSVTDAYIGLVWNAFAKKYRRTECKEIPFLGKNSVSIV